MKIKKVKVELARVKEERKNIREFSIFGDNNWEGMDIEIEYLERPGPVPAACSYNQV